MLGSWRDAGGWLCGFTLMPTDVTSLPRFGRRAVCPSGPRMACSPVLAPHARCGVSARRPWRAAIACTYSSHTDRQIRLRSRRPEGSPFVQYRGLLSGTQLRIPPASRLQAIIDSLPISCPAVGLGGTFSSMEVGGYSIGGWLFLGFIIFIVVYPIYVLIRSAVENHRSNASASRSAAQRPRAYQDARPVASSPYSQSARPRQTETRNLIFRRDAAPRGTGLFTLGYPNAQSLQGNEWILGQHQWYGENEVPTESRLNATAIDFIRNYYPSAEWVGTPENYIDEAEDWPVVTTGEIRVAVADHANRKR